MSYAEFIEWQEFYCLEPWGSEAEDVRWETYMRLFWSANSSKSDKPPRFIDWDPEETARLRREREAALTLDDKIRAYFGA